MTKNTYKRQGSNEESLNLLKIEIKDIALNEGKNEGLQLHNFKDTQKQSQNSSKNHPMENFHNEF